MPSAKPTQPPAADLSALVNRVDELSKKAGLGALGTGAKALPRWKRWIGGEKPDFDGSGLRDVVATNAIYLDGVKRDVDLHTERLDTQAARIEALENAPAVPFPGSG